MKKNLVIFDNSEIARLEAAKIATKLKMGFSNPETLSNLESTIAKGDNILISEFNLSCLNPNEINLYLDFLIKHQTPTVIHTNAQLYTFHLDQLEKTKVYSIIAKVPFRSEPILKKHIELLLGNPDYKTIKLLEKEKTTTLSKGPYGIQDTNMSNGYNPYYQHVKPFGRTGKF